MQHRQITLQNFQFQTSQRQAFLQIFNMYSKNGKINKKDLYDIFERIGYNITENHFQQLSSKIFQFNQNVTFEQFIEIFKVKTSNYQLKDIRNAFRLIAGEHDKYIPVGKVVEIFKKQKLQDERIKELLNVLSRYINQDKQLFDYQLFLSHLK